MHAPAYFSFPRQWTAADLANAVPLRLHQLVDFDAARNADAVTRSANHMQSRHGHSARRYAPLAALTSFRIR